MAYNVPDALLQTMLASLGRGAPSVSSQILVVDKGSTQPTEDGSMVSPFKSIQAALNATTLLALPESLQGWQIQVMPGFYDEDLVIPEVGIVALVANGAVSLGHSPLHPSPSIRNITVTYTGVAAIRALAIFNSNAGGAIELTGDIVFDDGGANLSHNLTLQNVNLAATSEVKVAGGHLGEIACAFRDSVFGIVNLPVSNIQDCVDCRFEGLATMESWGFPIRGSFFNAGLVSTGNGGKIYNTWIDTTFSGTGATTFRVDGQTNFDLVANGIAAPGGGASKDIEEDIGAAGGGDFLADGSVPMTGNLDMDRSDIIDALSIEISLQHPVGHVARAELKWVGVQANIGGPQVQITTVTLPQNALLLAVLVRVDQTIVGPAGWRMGMQNADPNCDRFGTNFGTAIGTTVTGIDSTTPGPRFYTTSNPTERTVCIRSEDGVTNMTAGKWQIAAAFIDFTPQAL